MRRIIEALHHQPWFATVGVYDSVKTLVHSKLEGKTPMALDGMSDLFVQRAALKAEPGETAIIDISGVLGRRFSNLEKTCGACDYGDILSDIAQARNQGVSSYLFHIDSGGGMATGCAEVASAIAALEVPTMAYIDGMGCSAAYYLASACDLVAASQSAAVGSIGAILPWIDSSKLMEFAGLDPQPITNEGADYKEIGFKPSLSEEQRAHLQTEVNDMGRMFKEFVLAKRPDIDQEVFRAGTYFGQRALDLGLIDLIDSMPAVHKLLKAEVDMSQRTKIMAENPNQATANPVPALTNVIADPGHSHNTSGVVYGTTSTGTLPAAGNAVAVPDFATRAELVAQLDTVRALIQELSARSALLETRCQILESNLRTTQQAISAIPNVEQVNETVDRRFAVHEASRGHGAPIKQPVEGANNPAEAARARTRTNPHVLKVLEQIGAGN